MSTSNTQHTPSELRSQVATAQAKRSVVHHPIIFLIEDTSSLENDKAVVNDNQARALIKHLRRKFRKPGCQTPVLVAKTFQYEYVEKYKCNYGLERAINAAIEIVATHADELQRTSSGRIGNIYLVVWKTPGAPEPPAKYSVSLKMAQSLKTGPFHLSFISQDRLTDGDKEVFRQCLPFDGKIDQTQLIADWPDAPADTLLTGFASIREGQKRPAQAKAR